MTQAAHLNINLKGILELNGYQVRTDNREMIVQALSIKEFLKGTRNHKNKHKNN